MPTTNIENAIAELNRALAERPVARLAFEQMPTKRKHKLIHNIAEVKKSADRKQRIEKALDALETWWAINRIKNK
ncbi:MAG TPA: YdeI/OmpD-associated family protein [Candidatus Saccharimonadales bacterium]|nr:YdeI/OmpD-associated family protein [Candidatus Saccharimonadales bacterium]